MPGSAPLATGLRRQWSGWICSGLAKQLSDHDAERVREERQRADAHVLSARFDRLYVPSCDPHLLGQFLLRPPSPAPQLSDAPTEGSEELVRVVPGHASWRRLEDRPQPRSDNFVLMSEVRVKENIMHKWSLVIGLSVMGCSAEQSLPNSSTSGGGGGNAGTLATGGSGGACSCTGEPGPQGPAGPAGKDGLPGKDGAPGAQGPAGPQGQMGLTGQMGPKGDTGSPGAPGAQGLTGATGATGATGPAGQDGVVSPAKVYVPTPVIAFAPNGGKAYTTAYCNAGDFVLSGGCNISSANQGVASMTLWGPVPAVGQNFAYYPTPYNGVGWYCQAYAGAGTFFSYSVTATAVCVQP